MLLKLNASVNHQDRFGWTAVEYGKSFNDTIYLFIIFPCPFCHKCVKDNFCTY